MTLNIRLKNLILVLSKEDKHYETPQSINTLLMDASSPWLRMQDSQFLTQKAPSRINSPFWLLQTYIF